MEHVSLREKHSFEEFGVQFSKSGSRDSIPELTRETAVRDFSFFLFFLLFFFVKDVAAVRRRRKQKRQGRDESVAGVNSLFFSLLFS